VAQGVSRRLCEVMGPPTQSEVTLSPTAFQERRSRGSPYACCVWTIVRDVFKSTARRDVRDALEEIASPLDTYGWSSAGTYFFWDAESRETLYIGLTIDLPYRFGQHVGLVGCPASGCKLSRIEAWFEEHETLGYSVALQSSNIQPIGHRLARRLGLDVAGAKVDPLVDLDPLPGELADFEGRLIEHHRLTFGERPPWNDKGGSAVGAAQVAGLGPDDLFAVVAGVKDSPVVSRLTIRELAADPTVVEFEEHIHTARIQAVMFGAPGAGVASADVLKYLDQLSDPFEVRVRMTDSGYLRRSAPFAIL
jgi:hypothetical protein